MAEDQRPPLVRGPNWNSPLYNAAMRPEPSWERLNSPSSRVTVKNTHASQTHIVIDKFNIGHELKPGEQFEMELLNEDIASFQAQRLPDRFYPGESHMPGMPKPPHAILIEGVPSMVEDQRKARDARNAEAAKQREEAQREQNKLRLPGARP